MRTFTLMLLCLLPLFAETVHYQIQPTPGSHVSVEVAKTGFMKGRKHVFLFDRYRGDLQFDPEEPVRSKLRIVFYANSAVLQDTWVREKDRRKIHSYALKEMLDAEQYPEVLFESIRVGKTAGQQYQVHGSLTIRGVSRPVVAELSKIGQTAAPAVLRFEGVSRFKLTDFGLKPPSAALGTIGTKDEVLLRFVLTAGRRLAS